MISKKSLLFLAFLCVTILLNDKALKVLAIFSAILFTFHLLVRKSIAFKPYFLSRYNLFSATVHKEFVVEIPTDLAFDKIIEVIEESRLKLVYAEKEKLQLLAISKISWKSWGENIYFALEERGNNTLVRFDSTALCQIHTWGKNEDNYGVFLNKLEQSFTI